MERTIPPRLVSLSAKGDMFRLPTPGLTPAEDYQSQVQWMVTAASVISSLQDVRISTSQTFTNISQQYRGALVKLREKFEQAGASMQLFRMRSNGAIPPFLYGERPDTEELAYASGGGGFLQRISLEQLITSIG